VPQGGAETVTAYPRHKTRAALRIGCSGWNYAAWRGGFYPRDLHPREWLRHYSTVFDTVEVNNTFYRLPETATFAAWRRQTPERFIMAVKASRFLTHLKRLLDPDEPIKRLLSRASALGNRLGPLLYQLPPNMPLDLKRLEAFLCVLPPDMAVKGDRKSRRRHLQHVIEFRHASWYRRETFEMLEQHGVAVCLHDKAESAFFERVRAPFVYVRFHGTTGRYHGSYSTRVLKDWAGRLADRWRDGTDIYAYFNNDPGAAATRNAAQLRRALLSRLQ
jgi:uncharacterized protein YecE (DUF72 family)